MYFALLTRYQTMNLNTDLNFQRTFLLQNNVVFMKFKKIIILKWIKCLKTCAMTQVFLHIIIEGGQGYKQRRKKHHLDDAQKCEKSILMYFLGFKCIFGQLGRVTGSGQKGKKISIYRYLSFKKKRKEIGSSYEELQVKMHFWSYRRPGWGFFQKSSIFVLFSPK